MPSDLPPDIAALLTQEPSLDLAAELLPVGPKRYNATFLGWAENCLLAAKRSKEVDNAGRAAVQGNAFHEVASTVSLRCKLEGRSYISVPDALAIAERVLAHPERPGPLSRAVYGRVMHMVSRWAAVMRFEPDADYWEIEVPAKAKLGPYTLSGRIDDVQIRGTHCKLTDYKTGARLPNDEEYEEHTQSPIYAWHVQQEHPYLETFELTELFVRFGVPRTIHLSAYEVENLEPWLLALCRRIDAAYATDTFPTTPGPHCAICPDKIGCPLPMEARPAALLGDEHAERVAERLLVERQQVKEDEAALKAYLEDHDEGAVYVNGQRLGYQPTSTRRLNKDRVVLALNGESMDVDAALEPFYDRSEGSEFRVRRARAGEGE